MLREEEMIDSLEAIAVLYPTEGYEAAGVVMFSETEEGVRITGTIEGLSPGLHGFHIHEYGNCSGAEAKTAGGHYGPRGMPHGGRRDAGRHIGDLGNIQADADGRARIDMIDTVISLQGKYPIIGRAVVVHAGEDDRMTQPSGAAGPRVACGVIGHAEVGP